MREILSESLYSLRRSMLFHIILVIQFTLMFWLAATLASYYLNLTFESYAENVHGDYAYYTLSNIAQLDQVVANMAIEKDPLLAQKMKQVKLQVEKDFGNQYLAADRKQHLSVSHSMLEEHFGDDSFDDFLAGSPYPGFYEEYKEQGASPPLPYRGKFFSKSVVLKTFRMNQAAIEHYGLAAKEGRLFEPDDYLFKENQKEIPVLLGSAYRPYFKVGDTFSVDFLYLLLDARVIGFLEEGTILVSDELLPENFFSIEDIVIETEEKHAVTLDHTIVYPILDIIRPANTFEENEFDEMNYEAFMYGTLVTEANVPRSQVTQMERDINEIYLRNGLFSVVLVGSPRGMLIFQRETQQTVSILMSLIVIMGLFCIASICLCLIAKINRNLRRYSIQMMNGKNLESIILSFLLEIGLIAVTALLISTWLLRMEIRYNVGYLWFIVMVAMMTIFLTSTVIVYKLKGLNIETIIRRGE